MENIILSVDPRYQEYEDLVLEKSDLEKECDQAWTAYMDQFGELICRIYAEQLECVKDKKVLEYYQMALNHGGQVNTEELDQYLKEQMEAYYTHLNYLKEETKACHEAGYYGVYEARRSKELYRRLAKLLHPDLNPHTDEEPKLKKLWLETLDAYGRADLRKLTELLVLTRQALKELNLGEIHVEIPDIDDKIEELREEIEQIKRSKEYARIELMSSKKACQEKEKELEKELERWQKYHQELDEEVQKMVNAGGIWTHGA